MLMTNHKRSAILKIGGPTQARPPQKQESELGPAVMLTGFLLLLLAREVEVPLVIPAQPGHEPVHHEVEQDLRPALHELQCRDQDLPEFEERDHCIGDRHWEYSRW